MKNYVLTLLLCLTAPLIFAQQQFEPQQLKQDFGVFRTALVEAHPGLYRYRTKAQITAQFNQLERRLNHKMTAFDFYKLLYPMMAVIGDGHTKFHLEGKPDDHYAFFDSGYLPLKLYFNAGRAFVQQTYAPNLNIKPGSEILSIDGIAIKAVTAQLLKSIFADGNILSAKYSELGRNFAGYYAEFIGSAKQFKIVYKDKNGQSRSTVVNGVKASAIAKEKYDDNQQLSFPKKEVALLRIGVFQDLNGKPTFNDFLKQAFQEIKKKNITALIIDLRDNEGGVDAMGIKLFTYIAKSPFRYYEKFTVASDGNFSFADHAVFPPELDYLKQFIVKVNDEYRFTQKEGLEVQQPQAEAFQGKVYILQNGSTFSVSTEFCAIAKDNRRATFIGDETGGALQGNTSGAFAMVRLPNTKLKLDIPLLGYYMHLNNQKYDQHGVLPNILVVPSITALLKGEDVVLEKTLQYIKTSTLKH